MEQSETSDKLTQIGGDTDVLYAALFISGHELHFRSTDVAVSTKYCHQFSNLTVSVLILILFFSFLFYFILFLYESCKQLGHFVTLHMHMLSLQGNP